ncbi:MAG TPA: TonB-dependent receptor plug domain-containing protein [Malonomonas sp.]
MTFSIIKSANNTYLKLLHGCILLIFIPLSVFADSGQLPNTDMTMLPTVVVEATKPLPESGITTLNSDDIKNLPNKNGTLTDYLKVVPGVQFSEQADTSYQAGEIEPANVSISGGRGYENNFLIDGISNSSTLDPYALKFDDTHILAGNPQDIYLSPSLIKSLTILDHNISARYGNFSGGAIEAETIDPASKPSGEISYRTTRDNWTKFYTHPDEEEDFQNADRTTRQPHFDKHNASFHLSGPINNSQGLLFAYALNYSRIPLTPFNVKEIQTRRSENYYLKHVSELSTDTTLKTSFTYAPYRAKGFLNSTMNSNFTNVSDTYALQSMLETYNKNGTFELKAAIKKNSDKREAPDHFYNWKSTYGETKDWGRLIGSSSSNEGGFGELIRTEQSINLQGHFSSNPIVSHLLETQLKSGIEYEHIQAKYNRPNTVYSYGTAKVLGAGDFCNQGDQACVSEEQYLSKRIVYPAGSSSERVNFFSGYLELHEKFYRFTIRPGLRIDYDDLMKNINPAPRLLISLDIFGDDKSTLTFGANRYYGQDLLAAKLRGAIQPTESSTRPDQLTEWSDPIKLSYTTVTKFNTLETPYSDELTFGFRQVLFSSLFTLDYIYRQNEDQLAKETNPDLNPSGDHEITLNNNGYSEYKSYRLGWKKQWGRNSLTINAAYEKVTSSNESYYDTLDDGDLEDYVYHDGELKLKTDLPREDYSRPWTANLIYVTDLPYGFSFTNTTRYQSRYRVIAKTNEPKFDTDGDLNTKDDQYFVYDEVSQQSALTFDWKISWTKALVNNHSIELNLDIFNVFNRKIPIGTEDNTYRLGRQYWAGLTYKF